MTVIHRVTGYNKLTERLSVEFDIPDDRLRQVSNLARVPLGDDAAFGSYPLDVMAVRRISDELHLPMSTDLYDWFLEPFTDA